jgi:hypothetical protein
MQISIKEVLRDLKTQKKIANRKVDECIKKLEELVADLKKYREPDGAAHVSCMATTVVGYLSEIQALDSSIEYYESIQEMNKED